MLSGAGTRSLCRWAGLSSLVFGIAAGVYLLYLYSEQAEREQGYGWVDGPDSRLIWLLVAALVGGAWLAGIGAIAAARGGGFASHIVLYLGTLVLAWLTVIVLAGAGFLFVPAAISALVASFTAFFLEADAAVDTTRPSSR